MKQKHRAGLGHWLAAVIVFATQSAIAQPNPGAAIAPAAPSRDPSDRLAANLVILSQNPRDVGALTEAGLSAIAVGDGDAALSFLARAEEISPSNARIKAAIGSALLLKEKPTDALKLFAEAISLGLPEQAVARDRGLAYDLRGDSKRAQRDYLIALRSGPDDELTIRYALSLGISGDDEKALELLDPLLRQRNLMAWRARAFVLAMNGDIRAAEAVANSVMPGGSGGSMSPFLRRLASLNPAGRALAVNFGIMPSDGQQYALVETGDPYRPSGAGGPSDALIPAGDPLGPRPSDAADRLRQNEPISKEPRRRPGREHATLAVAGEPVRTVPATASTAKSEIPPPIETASLNSGSARERVGKRIGPVDPSRLSPEVREALKPGSSEKSPDARVPQYVVTNATSLPPPSGAVVPSISAQASVSDQVPAARFEVAETIAAPAPQLRNPAPVAIETFPAFTTPITNQLSAAVPSSRDPQSTEVLRPAEVTPVPVPVQIASPPPATKTSGSGLGVLLSGLQTEEESVAGPMPNATEIKAARIAAQRKIAAEAKAALEAKAAKEAKDALRLAATKNPARIWVQIATGSNEAGLPSTWKKLKDKAPTVFKGQAASSVPFKATNRLLVGPFKNAADARALVNTMSKAGLSGSTFTSEAGQVIAKVSVK